MVGETEYRPSLGTTYLMLRKDLVQVACKSLGYVKLLDTAQQMQTWRRLGTIAAWILHLFGCILFPDATGDAASWMYT
jgi:hypothetical protein